MAATPVTALVIEYIADNRVGIIIPPSTAKDDLAVPRNQPGSSRQIPSFDMLVHHAVDSIEAFGRHAILLRWAGGKRGRKAERKGKERKGEELFHGVKSVSKFPEPHQRQSGRNCEAAFARAPLGERRLV
jgi:hypothetical protein